MAKNAFLFAETTEKTAYRDSKTQPAAAVPQLEPHKCPWHCPKWVQGQPGPQKQTACVSSLADCQLWGQDSAPVLGRLTQWSPEPDRTAVSQMLTQRKSKHLPFHRRYPRASLPPSPRVHGLNFIPTLWQTASLAHKHSECASSVQKCLHVSINKSYNTCSIYVL